MSCLISRFPWDEYQTANQDCHWVHRGQAEADSVWVLHQVEPDDAARSVQVLPVGLNPQSTPLHHHAGASGFAVLAEAAKATE